MQELLEDLVVVRKFVEVLDMLYGEGSKNQVENILISEIEDELYEQHEKSINDELYAEQKHRIRDALIACNILSYDGKTYRLLADKITEEHYDKVQKYLERKAIDDEKPMESSGEKLYDIRTQKEEFEAFVLNRIRDMKPFEFERLTTKLLRSCGLEFYPGNRTGDDGVDGYGYLEVAGLFKFKVLVQCKRYGENNKIANYAIRDLRGAVSTDAYKGLFVTTSSFTPRAKREAEKFPQIDMIDGRQFVELMIKNKVGIVEIDGKYSLEKDYLKHIELEEM